MVKVLSLSGSVRSLLSFVVDLALVSFSTWTFAGGMFVGRLEVAMAAQAAAFDRLEATVLRDRE